MTNVFIPEADPVRVPNLPVGKMVEEDGNPTQQELTFRQTLVTSLQNNFGSFGLVPPSQDSAGIAFIAANNGVDPITGQTDPNSYTCQGGTLIYNTDTNELMVAILVGGIPTFKNILHA